MVSGFRHNGNQEGYEIYWSWFYQEWIKIGREQLLDGIKRSPVASSKSIAKGWVSNKMMTCLCC